jgi:hypothetical protein
MRAKRQATAELLAKALAELASLRSEVGQLRQEVQMLRMVQPAITLPSYTPLCPPVFEPLVPYCPTTPPAQPPLPRRYKTEPDWWPDVWCSVKPGAGATIH